MEMDWFEGEDVPLYAAVKAAQALDRVRLKSVEDADEDEEPVDRSASVLTFRVRFAPSDVPELSASLNHRIRTIHEQRKAN